MEKNGPMATRKYAKAAKFPFSGNSRGIKRDRTVEDWGRRRSITKNLPKIPILPVADGGAVSIVRLAADASDAHCTPGAAAAYRQGSCRS